LKKIIPPRIQAGQNIGIVALSTPATKLKIEYRQRAYQKIKELLGVNIIEAPNIDMEMGHTAGSIKERVKSLHTFFKRKDIHAIMSFWGGFNTHQVLEYLDYELIKNNPKILIGYSDTTTLLSAITHKTGLITFNGPAVITFAKPSIPNETINSFLSLLVSGLKQYMYPVSEQYSDNQWWMEDKMNFVKNSGLKTFYPGKAQGEIVGGNMGTLLLLAGTSYWPNMKNKILFLEDDEAENSKTLDRYFTQFRQMGVFDKISGLVVGRFASCVGLNENDSLHMILKDALKGYKIPVITEFDMGHTDPIHTIPIGAKAEIDAKKLEVKILQGVVF
jgi:muramoyltetrapeptide carboxypeptidase